MGPVDLVVGIGLVAVAGANVEFVGDDFEIGIDFELESEIAAVDGVEAGFENVSGVGVVELVAWIAGVVGLL